MRLFLAPMEGVVDHHVRQLLTGIGGIDVCVTEFARITEQKLPEQVFKRLCPELEDVPAGQNTSQTASGTPVRVQLLGGNAEMLAYHAAKIANMGACAIDLNFGCPAKTVNKNDGGAKLLREPHRLYEIVSAVRASVPAHIPVTAKMRLGYEDRSSYLDNARAVFEGGATELAVHARSKADGYQPPAYWNYIADIRQAIDIPVVANGEIWNLEDFKRCREQSDCEDFMFGRGLLATPDLARQIKAYVEGEDYVPMSWGEVCEFLYGYYLITKQLYPRKSLGNRIKQWLMYMRLGYSGANQLFETIKRSRDAEFIEAAFAEHMQLPPKGNGASRNKARASHQSAY